MMLSSLSAPLPSTHGSPAVFSQPLPSTSNNNNTTTSTTTNGRRSSIKSISNPQQQSQQQAHKSHQHNNYNNSNNNMKTTPNSIAVSTTAKSLDKVMVNIGSRKSNLAIKQSEIVSDAILAQFPNLQTKITPVSTLGDQVQNRPLYSFGGKSLWTKELEILLYEQVGDFEKIDLIVHSLKDMPTNLPDGFELGCILKREDPRDALIMRQDLPYKSLAELPAGSIIGTSSVRRSAQLLKNYPHLCFKSVRGSIQTRVAKLDAPGSEYAGLLLAAAGLLRTGTGDRITQYLNEDIMYHAVGQGALGIEIRANDEFVKSICAKIRCDESTFCCLAERSLLRFLEGGCSVPIGCVTNYNRFTKQLSMSAIVVSVDGSKSVEQSLTARVACDADAESFGCEIGKMFLDNGAKEILDEIDYDKINETKQAGITSLNPDDMI